MLPGEPRPLESAPPAAQTFRLYSVSVFPFSAKKEITNKLPKRYKLTNKKELGNRMSVQLKSSTPKRSCD